ncbi:redoxin domain-containing protein [Telmatocola sphagniphila]|jgi:hypothetical protein|uniref:Redoxin domain-containing protein n=1 Tax=Telmatocola sphagniphila TaxID=1123043 RepID=A0A8E6B6G2_9BACT|nr:redoxin domain-containing protein [Telmatocola sphagniphila]QVL32970.1 redoxin domain-containing protein [Telmatocola sphagniphila]
MADPDKSLSRVVTVFALAFIAAVIYLKAAPMFKKSLVGKPAPEIVGRDLNDKEMRLSDYRGKVVMLDFWGHW